MIINLRFRPWNLIGACLLLIAFLIFMACIPGSPWAILRAVCHETVQILVNFGIVKSEIAAPEAVMATPYVMFPPPAIPSPAVLPVNNSSAYKLGMDSQSSDHFRQYAPLFKTTNNTTPDLTDLWPGGGAAPYLDRLLNGERLSATEWGEVGDAMVRARTLVGVLSNPSKDSSHPAEDVALVQAMLQPSPDAPSKTHPVVSPAALIRESVDLLCADSLGCLNNLDPRRAVQRLKNAVQIARLTPIALLDTQGGQTEAMAQTIQTAFRLANRIDEPALLENLLHDLNNSRRDWVLAMKEIPEPAVRDLVARVRMASLESGMATRIQSLEPEKLLAQLGKLNEENLQRKIEGLDETARQRLQDRIDKGMEEARRVAGDAMKRIAAERSSAGSADAMRQPDSTNLSTQTLSENVLLAEMDLLRIDIATRIAAQEQPERPLSDPDDLTPRFLPLPVADPFTQKPFVSLERGNAFYSLGPDRKDNGAAILYDPSNGSLSAGDVFLGPPAEPR